MGQNPSSMGDEIGKALAAKDPSELTNNKQDSLPQQEKEVEEKSRDEIVTSGASVVYEKSENSEQSNTPCMRDKIDNLIEGYLLSGEFNVNAKTSKSKTFTSKKFQILNPDSCEETNEKMQEKDVEHCESLIDGLHEEESSNKEDNAINEIDSKGDNSAELNEKGNYSQVQSIKESNSSTEICDKIENRIKEESKLIMCKQLSKNENGDESGPVLNSEEFGHTSGTSEKVDEKVIEKLPAGVKNNKSELNDDFIPVIPCQKKSTTTFQTLIDRVLDSSLNCPTTPTEKTNILECCDQNFSKTLKNIKLGNQNSEEGDAALEKPVSKVNNVRKASGGNDDMSISKAKGVCLKDHIEKVLEKSFQSQMSRKSFPIIEQNKRLCEEQVPVKQEANPQSALIYDKNQSVQGHNNAQSHDKTFNAQELVDTMIDQSKVINKLLLPPTTSESSLTGESTLASLERTAMNFEKYPIQCPSEVAKNDDYMIKYEKKSDGIDKLNNVKQSSVISDLSPNSQLTNAHHHQKLKYTPEQLQSSDSRYSQNSSLALNKESFHQQPSPGYEQQRMQMETGTNQSSSKKYFAHAPGIMHTTQGPRQTAPSNLSPTLYKNTASSLNSMRHDYQSSMNNTHHEHPSIINSNMRHSHSDVINNTRNDHPGTINNTCHVHPGVINNSRHDNLSALNTQHDHLGTVNSQQQDNARFSHSACHDNPGSHNRTISVRDCSCISCNTNPQNKAHNPVHNQGIDGRHPHYIAGSFQIHENGRQHPSNISPHQLNVQHGIMESKHGIDEEIPVMPPVSSAMALGPSPPHQYFQQNRMQHQHSQNQYKRPQLIPSSPPIASSREYSGRTTEMPTMIRNTNNTQRDNQTHMSTVPMIRHAVPVSKQGMGSVVHYTPNLPIPPEMLKGNQAHINQPDDRSTANMKHGLRQHQHHDDSWNKMRDEFQKDVNNQVRNALHPSVPESVLDLSVKKTQQSQKTQSEDEPLDLTCKVTQPSFIGVSQSNYNVGVVPQMQQEKNYSNQGPTHIHHLESSVDKFCQNVRPLEENFHRNDKLSAQFQHRVPPADHTSPKHVYQSHFRVPNTMQLQSQSETKLVPVVAKIPSQMVSDSGNHRRPMPPPLMMVTGYVPQQQSNKSGPYLSQAHSQSKQLQQLQNGSQYQQVPRQSSPRQPSPRQPSPQLSQQQYQQPTLQKRQESPGINDTVNGQPRNLSKRSSNVSKHEPIQNIIGIHSPSDILYLICRLCGQTYGSPYGFRKHFRNQHGFEPRAEHTIVQTISATKTALKTPPSFYQGAQGPPKVSQSSPGNIEDQKFISGSTTMTPQVRQPDSQSQETHSNESSQSPDLESQNMMMVVKKAIDQSVSVAFKTDDIGLSNSLKKECFSNDYSSEQYQNRSEASEQYQNRSEASDEIKFLECHECGQTFQLNDFGSYKRHCRQHGQPKLVNSYPSNDVQRQVDTEHVSSNETMSGKDSDDSMSTICKYCNIPFATATFLKDHLNSVHPEEMKFKIKTRTLKEECCQDEGDSTYENKENTLVCSNSGYFNSLSPDSQNKFTIKAIPSSDIQKMPADRMTISASPDSSSEQVIKLKWTVSDHSNEEKIDKEKDGSVMSQQNISSPTGGEFCNSSRPSEDQDSRNSFDLQIKSPSSNNYIQRQISVESGSLSENAEPDKSAESESENVRYLHKKFKRKGSISVSSDVSNAKNPKLNENVLNDHSPCSVKSPSAYSSVSNDSELSNLLDGNCKKSEDNGDIELEMPELQPGVDFTEVDDNSQERSSKLIVKYKCGPEGILNKPEARHQLPFVWDRITRSQAGKNIKPPNYH